MTIRIDRIESELTDEGYRWRLRAKGLFGQGIYFTVETGLNGQGLYALAHQWELDFFPDKKPVVTRVEGMNSVMGDSRFELVPPDRFEVHEQCSARDVVHRVATALVMIGWGSEFFEDRDSISGRRTVHASLVDRRRKPVDSEAT